MPTKPSSAETRIRNLIRLSQHNDNVHEAAAAYAKAQQAARDAGWSGVGTQLVFKKGLRALSPDEARWRAFGYVRVGNPVRKTSDSSAVYVLDGKEHWMPNMYIKVIEGAYFAPKKMLGIPEPQLEEWKDPPNA